MDSIPRYGETATSQRKEKGTRRTMNNAEEQALLDCLKELISKGYKSDNGFRPGYLQALAIALNARIPASKLSVKNINSKLTVWKKVYYQILGMQGTSGFGWNDTSKMITVDDDVWALYAKAHPDVANMRFKTYPYYEDWVEIFGKDRATGDGAEDVIDIVEDLLNNDAMNHAKNSGKSPMIYPNSSDYAYSSPCVDLLSDASDGEDFETEIPPYQMGLQDVGPKLKHLTRKLKNEKIKSEKVVKKRKTLTPESDGGDLSKFVDAAKTVFGDLNHQFAKEEDSYDEKSKKIINALECIDTLTCENRVFLSFKIMDNAKHVSLFLNSSEEARIHICHMMLNNQMP